MERSSREFRGEVSKKLLKTSSMVTNYQKQYYAELRDRAAQGEPVIWTCVGTPTELMHAMDIPIVYTLQWSALLAAKQMSAHCLDVLNEHGYFRDLCRYCSQPLGYFLEYTPEQGPWGGLPRPTALVFEAADDPVVRIWELLAERLNVPLYIWEKTMIAEPPDVSSFCETEEDIEKEAYREGWRVDFAVRETEGLISFLETVTGRTLSQARLREVMERSNEQFDYIGKTMDLCARVPAPISIADHIPNLITTQFFRGHEFGLTHARMLYEEVKDRVDRGLAACEKERIRLAYLLVPNWFTPGFYNAFEEKYGAVFVWMLYFTIPRQLIRRNLSDPLKALASRYVLYTEVSQPSYFQQWVGYYLKKFKIDGLVWQLPESCRLLASTPRLAVREFEKMGVPTLEIRGDMVDIRDWDDAKMKATISNFIEMLQ
jgi:benzoyl-CoA reductase subunit B